ncbi:hypothetical protein ACH95_06465 [Bacillus glycinifermentans]|uniref:Spore coat protein n=1 Tax=Bacillus glycinifermentans TaxID=1664069 RepID=A0A0J6ENC2_9BACI|nr:hypothetical protein [Bacillus glycinifermentans]ATH95050.1 hypothetical protein COP00_22785 [Bacillus glycinifermentans]KMM62011.1 hypothetical protein ACH95_06465 [Bacillus glycinifermentans]KRT93241.1 hypothetical protein AB447_220055 [Bacillus glycinifermentans]MEC0487575.1 hypothetical protein [Bacillus glycinifermentans]MEC0495819.1 hypothetical protein [Bacillus glycinifermentans]
MADDDFFTKMMFGSHPPGKREDQSEKHEDGPDGTTEAAEMTEPDYMHIMNQIGQIMDSIDELKPAFKEIGSMVSTLKNKISK